MLWEIIVKGYNPIKSVCPLSCMHIIYYESFTVIWALILMANSNYVAPILKVRDTVEFQNIVVLHEYKSDLVTVSYCYLQCYENIYFELLSRTGHYLWMLQRRSFCSMRMLFFQKKKICKCCRFNAKRNVSCKNVTMNYIW